MQHICPEHAPQCQAAPNRGLARPTLTSTRTSATELSVSGKMIGAPATRYVIELFGNTAAAGAETEMFLEQAVIYTDASGNCAFTLQVERARIEGVRSVTATLTSDDGATSALSDALPLQEAPSR